MKLPSRATAAASAVFAALPSPALGADTADVVQVYVAGTPEAVARTRGAVQELCAASALAVVVRDAADAGEELLANDSTRARVRGFVDLRRLDAPRVVVVDGHDARELERRTLPAQPSLETSVEASAHVLCMAVEASLALDEPAPVAATARPEPEPPKPARAGIPHDPGAERRKPRSVRHRRWEADLSAFGVASALDSRHVPLGGEIALEAGSAKDPLRFEGLAALAFFAPVTVRDAAGSARVSTIALRLSPAVEWRTSAAVALATAAGVGADLRWVTPETAPPGTVSKSVGTRFDPVVSGLVAGRFALGGGIRATAGVACDVDLAPLRYVVRSPAGRTAFFAPARVRPGGFIGLTFPLLGGEPGSRTEALR